MSFPDFDKNRKTESGYHENGSNSRLHIHFINSFLSSFSRELVVYYKKMW